MINVVVFFFDKTKILMFLLSLLPIIVCYLLFTSFSFNFNSNNKTTQSQNSNNNDNQIISDSNYLNPFSTTIFFTALSKYFRKFNKIKKKQKILGYHTMSYSQETKKYLISDLITENISLLSKNIFNWIKQNINAPTQKQELNKNKEMEKMFIECIATSNSRSKYIIQKSLLNQINWDIIKTKNHSEDEGIISYYIKYKNEATIEEKLNNQSENFEYEDEIIYNHYELGVVRIFDCEINNYKLTTIVKNINGKYFKIYCQGSPKAIKSICNNETMPENFDELLNYYLSKKKIVFALAGKMLKMNYLQAMKIEKNKCEKNMMFLGLIIFDTILK